MKLCWFSKWIHACNIPHDEKIIAAFQDTPYSMEIEEALQPCCNIAAPS
jgi:hypothetical protein